MTVWYYGLGSSGSGQGPVMGSCEHGNEPTGSIKAREFLDHHSDYKVIKKSLVSNFSLASLQIMILNIKSSLGQTLITMKFCDVFTSEAVLHIPCYNSSV
jgi:hypothetical protein